MQKEQAVARIDEALTERVEAIAERRRARCDTLPTELHIEEGRAHPRHGRRRDFEPTVLPDLGAPKREPNGVRIGRQRALRGKVLQERPQRPM